MSASTVGTVPRAPHDGRVEALRLRPVPLVLLVSTVVIELAAVVLSWGLEWRYDTLMYAVNSVVMAGAGALVASRHPGNPIGWLLAGFGLLNAVAADLAQGWALRADAAGWPGVEAGEWVAAASWPPGGLGWALVFLLFPDGRLLGPRWRPVAWTTGLGALLVVLGWCLGPASDAEFSAGRNPLTVDWLPTAVLLYVGAVLLMGGMAVAAGSLVIRLRRSTGLERRRLEWLAFAATLAVAVLPVTFVLWSVSPLARVMAPIVLTALPIAAAVAILRYRLYDIDVVVLRTLVYATLTVLLAGTYAVAAVVLGTALGRGSGWVTAGATLAVAVVFRPLRDRVQDVVDRRFDRARYDAVNRVRGFLEDLRSGLVTPEDVEPLLRDLVGDPELRLVLFLPESREYVDVQGTPVPDDGRPRLEVHRQGRPVGAVLHGTTDEARLAMLRRLVEAGGLAVEIARLSVELRRQLAEVDASRARIVEATDAERRRIERDLHDGAQQRLVGIGLALRHTQHLLGEQDTRQARESLDDAVAQVALAVEELRGLARGLPPSQLDAGLGPAFRDLAGRSPVPVELDAPSERFERGVEAAAYFVGCEGLTNAVKHAQASRVSLSAGRTGAFLVVTVTDDGVGGATTTTGAGLAGLTDRVAALGGTLRVVSRPGAGTTLTAELPCAS